MIKKIMLFASVGLVILLLFMLVFKKTNTDYVDGNVLNLALLPDIKFNYNGVMPAWANNGLLSHCMFRTLFLADASVSEFTPDLAKNYTISQDNLVYTVELKENLLWSDNTPITSEDIKASLDAVGQAESSPLFIKELFRKVQSVQAIDNTIVITLHTSHAYTLQILSQIVILPKKSIAGHDLDSFYASPYWSNPIVSGMFMLDKEQEEGKITLVHNPLYDGVKPQIEKIVMHGGNAKLDSYITSDISEMINFRSMRNLKEYKIPSYMHRHISFNMEGNDGNQNPAMQDINTRKAIAQAIDRAKIAKQLYHNIASIPEHSGIADASQYEDFSYKPALEFLKKSSYDLERPLRIGHAYTDETSMYCVQYMANDLEHIGFNVEIVKEDSIDALIEKRNFDFLVIDLPVLNNIDRMLEYASEHPFARIYGGKGEFDSLIKQIRQNQDIDKYAGLLSQIYQLAEEKFYRFPIMSVHFLVYINEERLEIPKDLKLGQPNVILNYRIPEWKIIKK